MSIEAPDSPEQPRPEEHLDTSNTRPEIHKHTVETKPVEKRKEDLEHFRGVALDEAKHKDEVLNLTHESETDTETTDKPPANKELRGIGLKKELKHIRTKLSAPDKVGSKIIHNPAIRAVSEVSSKTISRPSGLLGGGLTAFIGSALYLYLTKHIGLKYNYLVFAILFVGGFILGLIIELGVYTLHSKKSTK